MPKATSGSSVGGKSELSEYELQRLKNISCLDKELGDLYTNVTNAAQDMTKAFSNSTIRSPNNKRKRESQQWHQNKTVSAGVTKTSRSQITRRSARLCNSKTPQYNEQDNSDDDDKPKKLRLKFPFFKKKEYETRDVEYYGALDDSDFITSDEEQIEYNDGSETSPKRRRTGNPHQVPVSLITTEMLENISYSSSNKCYSSNGTTCHQCRQKTLDQKSYCRYKKCRGIRGMFCGFCLGTRYGEDVAEVLLNKKWACPPCRGYCNCSICRRKRGKSPTGQLSHIAKAEGYKSVKHMLECTEGDNMEKNLSSDYDSDENDENENSCTGEKKIDHGNNVLSQEEMFDRIYRLQYPSHVNNKE